MAPRLSIVIPAYNVEHYIGEAVASALTQTLENIEVIVVNDGSTDGTAEVVAAFSDSRLRLITQPNGGLAHARNTGVRHAVAGYIGFLDGDDRWFPEKAARHLETMERDPKIGATFCHSRYIDEVGRPTGQILVASPARPTLLQVAVRNMLGNGSTPVVRADCFVKVGLFNEALLSWEDWEMWLRILRDSDYAIVLVPETLTDYRIRKLSLSHNFDFYMENAEFAARVVREASPTIPSRHLARGLAASYRITGSKAAKLGYSRKALELFAKAVNRDPTIVFRDPRFIATLVYMVAPPSLIWLGNRLAQRRAGLGPVKNAAK